MRTNSARRVAERFRADPFSGVGLMTVVVLYALFIVAIVSLAIAGLRLTR
jgi:hypothetical protein